VDDNSNTQMMTVAEAAARLGRSVEQVRRYLREGKLRGRRIGQQWFIEGSALESKARAADRVREAAAAYELRPPSERPEAPPAKVVRMETRRMNKDEIERLIAEVTALRERIKARRGGEDLPMTAAQIVRLDREEH
jgi:excisionase family DNA binding protein